MFGLGIKPKHKRTYKRKSSAKTSRVDKLISILDEANKKDQAERVKGSPKRKYVKRKGLFEGLF